MSQKLLHKFRVHTFAQQQCCARVLEVVEADGVGETGLLICGSQVRILPGTLMKMADLQVKTGPKKVPSQEVSRRFQSCQCDDLLLK
jgi:hypothetical protein